MRPPMLPVVRRLRPRSLRALLAILPKVLVVVLGLWLILSQALAAQGGKSPWAFSSDDRHRFTSMAMLTGTLRLRNGLSTLSGDEQAYGGASYTNWGYGAPLMQLPFEAAAHWLGAHAKKGSATAKRFASGFFPDRAIHFAYVAMLAPALWLAIDRALASRGRGTSARFGGLSRTVLAGATTVLALTCALYPLTSSRFIIYEETIAYFVIVQLFALSAYVFVRDTRSLVPVCALAVAAGLGLLTRATGLGYLGMWGALVLLERRTVRSVAAFSLAAAPLVGFWLYSNWVKAGSPLSFGYENGMPWFPFHTGLLRFRNYRCADTLGHAWIAATQLFEWLCVDVPDPTDPHLLRCHFVMELRSPAYSRDGFLGPTVLVFLCWVLGHYVARRERKLSLYLPLVTVAFLFFNYARTVGFAWRYVGDFWPLVLLIAVQYARWLPSAALPQLRLAGAFAFLAFVGYETQIKPALVTVDNLGEGAVANLAASFKQARYGEDPPLPSRIACGSLPGWPYHNGQGWGAGCTVDTYTNVFLRAPKKTDGHYDLRFGTQGFEAKALRVFVNGRIYTARREGDGYVATFDMNYARLHTPSVMVAVEWTAEPDPLPGKLMWIELS